MEKLDFCKLDKNGTAQPATRFSVPFNPSSYSVGKSVGWTTVPSGKTDAPKLEFAGGGSRTLTMELFFDVTEPVPVGGTVQRVDDVRSLTRPLVELTRFDAFLDRPPVVEVAWGGNGPALSDFPFRGVVTSLNQTFTLFSADGKPLRATASLAMLEYLVASPATVRNAGATTTTVVSAGSKLDAIAAKYLGDPAKWRDVAKANGLNDPRRPPVGLRLTVPGR